MRTGVWKDQESWQLHSCVLSKETDRSPAETAVWQCFTDGAAHQSPLGPAEAEPVPEVKEGREWSPISEKGEITTGIHMQVWHFSRVISNEYWWTAHTSSALRETEKLEVSNRTFLDTQKINWLIYKHECQTFLSLNCELLFGLIC